MILKETILSVFNERATLLKWLKKVEALTSEIIERAILKPIDNPQSTNLVGVDNTGAQVMLEVGAGLTIDNGVIKFANVYDGTVIIEKPINWGTRKFKETVEAVGSIELNEEGSINSYDKELLDEYGFDIEPTNFGSGQYALKLSCAFDVTYNGVVQKGIIIKIENEGQFTITVIPLDIFDLSFNILSTANSTVDEWLLANTEGVSV